MLSVSSCLTSRGRLAPIASRTAISLRRSVARVSSRLARFTQASRSTSAPTAARTPVKAKTEFAMSGMNKPGFPRANTAADVFGIIFRQLRGDRLEFGLRLRERDAGFEPADDEELLLSRRSSHLLPGSIVVAIIIGMNISGS